MIFDFLENIRNSINWFDVIFSIIMIYSIIQCFLKGFSLSLMSFMKWVLSTVITIILVPKFQPWVSEYIESDFINNVGLGIVIFICTLFQNVFIFSPPKFLVIFFFPISISIPSSHYYQPRSHKAGSEESARQEYGGVSEWRCCYYADYCATGWMTVSSNDDDESCD